ncbi:hypothetical protein HY373_00970 [Candidatus Berkelbacteria bacterium]|nr:hypothetical protein [Candidatus Berkelbacteria bacterium]MBI4029731.1 hypothetical protein [Candidatus Berkelbacteria bacterium]
MPTLTKSPQKIWQKLENLEEEIRRLKWEVALSSPKTKPLYPEEEILPTVRKIRQQLFQERYGGKI